MIFSFPTAHWRLIRPTNGVERLHGEVRRRARVVSIFPNPASFLRLISAVLAEISDEWLTGRTNINFQGSEWHILFLSKDALDLEFTEKTLRYRTRQT